MNIRRAKQIIASREISIKKRQRILDFMRTGKPNTDQKQKEIDKFKDFLNNLR